MKNIQKWRKNYTGYLGGFDYEWKNPPSPFNDQFDPNAELYAQKASKAVLEQEPFKSRKARAQAWHQAYDQAKQEHTKHETIHSSRVSAD